MCVCVCGGKGEEEVLKGLKTISANRLRTVRLPPVAQGSKALEAVEDGKGGGKGCAKARWRDRLSPFR